MSTLITSFMLPRVLDGTVETLVQNTRIPYSLPKKAPYHSSEAILLLVTFEFAE